MKKSELRHIIREEVSKIKLKEEEVNPYEEIFDGEEYGGENIDSFIALLEQHLKAAKILKRDGENEYMDLGSLIGGLVDSIRWDY